MKVLYLGPPPPPPPVNPHSGVQYELYHVLCYRGDYWMVTEAKQQRKCFRPNGTEVEDISYCEFYYSFCHALPDNICPSIIRTADIKPSVCQKVYYNNGSTIEYDMGKFSTEHEYHPASKLFFYERLPHICVCVCACVCVCCVGACVCVMCACVYVCVCVHVCVCV